jgi:hypothetical protein
MEKELIATSTAILSDVSLITLDRINALTGGHGSLNIAGLSAANAILSEILSGESIKLKFSNVPVLSIDAVIKKGIDAAKKAGAAPVNAALITALILYFAGSKARAGLPAANRKLGALCRIHAGVDRGGVINIPTPKMGNRLTAFPAIKALYEAIAEKKLTQVDPRNIPMGVVGGAIFGHNALGEDIVFPEIAKNGAKIAVKAMMEGYRGLGLPPSQIICAILGSAATLEIVHPEAYMGEQYGPFGTDTPYVVGKFAAKTAQLPAKLHIRGTKTELETAKVVGDLGLIFKDIGAPTVVGMIFFNDFLMGLEEGIMGTIMPNAVGPINSTLAHVPIYDIIPTVNALIEYNGDTYKTADLLYEILGDMNFDPEMRRSSAFIVSRKAEEITFGPVTESLILATEGSIINAIQRRAKFAYQEIKAGRTVEDIARYFDEQKKLKTENFANEMFSQMMGKKVEINLKIGPQSRRTDGFTKDFWTFDAYCAANVAIGDEKFSFDGLLNNVIPDAVLNKKKEFSFPIMFSTITLQELMYSGCCILNIIVPCVIGALLGIDPAEASKMAAKGAWINNTVPGASERAFKVAKRAMRIMKNLND